MSRAGKSFTVKVQNLSKATERSRIWRIIPMVSPNDISLKNCPDAPANYAYVNCEDFRTAQLVTNLLHNTCLDNSKLTAKMKRECSSSEPDHGLYLACSTRDRSFLGSCNRPPSPELRVKGSSRSRSRSPIALGSRLIGLDVDSGGTRNQFRLDQTSRVYSTRDICGRGERDPETRAHPGTTTSSGDTKTIKVSIHGSGVTEVDLDDYFSLYGTLANKTVIRPGEPIYAYVNFESNAAAQGACISSRHHINGTFVTAVLKSPKGATPVVHNLGLQPANAALPCNPLAIDKAQEEMAKHFSDLKDVKIIPTDDRIVIHVPQEIADSAIPVFKKVIKANEDKIVSTEISLNLCFYPALANQTVGKKLLEVEKKFNLKIEHNGEKISLEQFRKEWKQIANGLASQISQSSSCATESTHQWCWFDDDTYRPYGSTANEQIEAAFQSQTSLSLSIGAQDYVIDTASKQQTNQMTKKVRNIHRRQLCSARNFNAVLHLICHESYIQEVKGDILEKLDSLIHETKIHLPDSLQNQGPFVELLLTSAAKNFVQASVNEEGTFVIVRGTAARTNQSRMEIQTRILGKERELGRMTSMRLPDNWVEQEDNCELKTVPTGSPEWLSVQKRFMQPHFNVRITKVERIQNKWLWEAYLLAKDRMFSKNGEHNEKLLFHGTKETSPKAIYNSEQGFDNRLASQGLYGEGAYFAEKSSYSHDYAHRLDDGCKQMFLAKVITGMSYECDSTDRTLKAPPPKPMHESSLEASGGRKFEGERYDSVTAVTNGSRIYVIYELGRVYPAYLITYKTHIPEGLGNPSLVGFVQFKF